MGDHQFLSSVPQNFKRPLNLEQSKVLKEKYTVIDARPQGHILGIIKKSYWLPGDALYCSWLGCILKPDECFLLVSDPDYVDTAIQVAELMGYVNCVGYNAFDMTLYDGQLVYPELKTFKEINQEKELLFLDIRTPNECISTGVVKGAKLVELKRMAHHSKKELDQLKEIQKKKLIVINCRTGQRVRVAASILLRHGINSVALLENVCDLPNLGLQIISVEENQIFLLQIAKKQKNSLEPQSDEKYKSQNTISTEGSIREIYTIDPSNDQQNIKQIHSGKRQLEENIKTQDKIQTLIQEGDFDKAIQQLKIMLMRNPEDVSAHINLGICFVKLNRITEAKEQLLKALQKDNFNEIALFNLSSVTLLQSGVQKQQKYKNSIQYLKKSLSCLYFKKGKKYSQIQDLTKSLEHHSDNIIPLLMRGLLFCEKGKWESALKDLERINLLTSGDEKKISSILNQVNKEIQKEKQKLSRENQIAPKIDDYITFKKANANPKSEENKNAPEKQSYLQKDLEFNLSELVSEWKNAYRELHQYRDKISLGQQEKITNSY